MQEINRRSTPRKITENISSFTEQMGILQRSNEQMKKKTQSVTEINQAMKLANKNLHMEIDELKENIINVRSNNYGLLENENALKDQINTQKRANLHAEVKQLKQSNMDLKFTLEEHKHRGIVGINKRDENIRELVRKVYKSRDELVLGEEIISNQGEKIYMLERDLRLQGVRDKREIGELGALIVNLGVNMKVLQTKYESLIIHSKQQINDEKHRSNNLGNIVQNIKTQTKITTTNLKNTLNVIEFKHSNKQRRTTEKYDHVVTLNKNIKTSLQRAEAELGRLKSLINSKAEEVVKLMSKKEIIVKSQIFHSLNAVMDEIKNEKNKDMDFLRGQLDELDGLSAALGQNMGDFNELSDANTLKVKARIFSSTNQILRQVQTKEMPTLYKKYRIMDIYSEYMADRKGMWELINTLREDNIVLRNENIYKEGENRILGQKLKENKQVWRTELVNLKEELVKTHDMFEKLKTIHIEYKNQPDELQREEIINLEQEKDALRENILQLEAEKEKVIKNLKSIILDQKTNVHSSSGSSDPKTMLFIKTKLQDYDDKFKAMQAAKDNHINTINNPMFLKQNIDGLKKENSILGKTIKEKNIEIDMLRSDKQTLKVNIESMISNFNHLRNTHTEYKNTPDEIYRQELVILNDQKSKLKRNNDMLKVEIVRLNGDKMNLKSSLILSLHSRHTNSDMGTNTDDLSNRFIKMKYEDLVYQQKLFVENMNNKLNDLSAVNIRLKHNIIMGNERLKARKTVHKEKESYTPNDEIFRKQIEDLLDESTKNNQRLHAQIER